MTIIQSFVGANTGFNANVALTGISATGAIGSLIAGSNVAVTTGSVTATALIASPSVTASASTALSGVSATANISPVNAATTISVSEFVVGVGATASVGVASGAPVTEVFVSGVQGTLQIGSVDIQLISNPSVLLTGITGTSEIGSVIGRTNLSPSGSIDVGTDGSRGVFVGNSGTRMYLSDSTNEAVVEYDLSTPYDVTTATFSRSKSIIAQDSGIVQTFFDSSGTRFFFIGGSNDRVYQYSASSAWDISTISFVRNFSVSSIDTTPAGLFFKTDGTKMYISGLQNDRVTQFDLSTAWDISTASNVGNFNPTAQVTALNGLYFTDDGTTMFIAATSGVFQYSLGTPWTVSTATFVRNIGTVQPIISPAIASVFSLSFKEDLSRAYVTGSPDPNLIDYSVYQADF